MNYQSLTQMYNFDNITWCSVQQAQNNWTPWNSASILLWLGAPSCSYCPHMSELLLTEFIHGLTEVGTSATHFSQAHWWSNYKPLFLFFKWLLPEVWQVPSLTVQPKGFSEKLPANSVHSWFGDWFGSSALWEKERTNKYCRGAVGMGGSYTEEDLW